MKKTLLAITLIGALAACSQEKTATKPAETAASASTAPTASLPAAQTSKPVIVDGVGSEQEKADLQKLGTALKDSGMQEGRTKEAEWNQRLAAAKNNADIQSVFNEQFTLYEKAENAVKAIQMESEAGKTIHTQMLNGFSGMRALLADMKAINFDQPDAAAKAEALKPRAQQHGIEIMNAMQGFVNLMKANGLQAGSAQEAEFNQKMEELKEKVQ